MAISRLTDNIPCENVNTSTLLIGFHLTPFVVSAKLQVVVFIIVFLMYLLSVLGNMIITVLICIAPQLHTPMYRFLCSLSLQDIVYVSSILPKLLTITIIDDTRMSFLACITQIFLFIFCIGTEIFLLTSMAYDRFVAICKPLHYSLIMNKRMCALLSTSCWLISALHSMVLSVMMSRLSFCNLQKVNHFFCDPQTLLKISYSDTTNFRRFITFDGIFLGWCPFMLILISYKFIISAILKITTSAGRLKAFSSCSSHLTVVILFCGTALSLNMKPTSQHSQELGKVLSILYIAVVPVLNPLVYSLRNRDVLKAIEKCLKRKL